ncbi:type II secretion system protein [Microcella daejeonensis]|uniref:Type II secretion system protein n=1 Tax=Microcella daejeonensis TaxID=2994971 RepID=A0A9E8MNB8_9MICO|nr:type II secretion system protein [Microcella daejeonensis]WAB82646.1 type II secretion system protein [Microcella daejeonensis]
MSRFFARAMRRLRHEDAGFSLPELMVTIFVMGVLSAVVVSFYVAMTGAFTEDRSATDSTSTASVGMNNLTRVIRAGTEIRVQGQTLNNPVFIEAKNEDLTLHAYLDTDSTDPRPIKVRFWINAQRELMETRWDSTRVNGSYFVFDSTPESTRVIARTVATRTGTDPWLFTYRAADGTVQPVPTTGSFTTNQLRNIASVQVRLTVQADITSRAAPVTLQSTVGIPNLGISRVSP